MHLKKYYIRTGLIALLLSPIAASIGLIGVALVVPPIITLALVWVLYSRKAALPEKASELFLPIFLAFCYYLCIWITVFGFSSYRFESSLFGGFYYLSTAPFFVINLFLDIGGDFRLFPLANVAILIITILSILITCAIRKKKIIWDKKTILFGLIFIFLTGIAGFQHYDRSTKILERDYHAERIEDEVNLHSYRPFNKDNLLKQLDEPASISFYDNYPILDGATAAYPVYAAMAQEIYKGLSELDWAKDRKTIEQYIDCSKTDGAYERLIRGEIDIFFGAQPSKQQIESAKNAGLEFVLTPIAKEAFVFFVNKENPVSTLSFEQIQDIYQKKIINWSIVGGNDEKIMPFQRPENSGSQTIMLAMIMRYKSLPIPLWEE